MFKAKSSYTFIEILGDCSIFCSLFVIRKKGGDIVHIVFSETKF